MDVKCEGNWIAADNDFELCPRKMIDHRHGVHFGVSVIRNMSSINIDWTWKALIDFPG